MEMDNKTREQIGLRINAALALSGKQQKELAKELDVPDNTVSYWCSGARTPNTAQIIGIARFTDVSADYLLGLSDVPSPDTDVQAICDHFGMTEEAYKGLSIFYGKGEEFLDPDYLSALQRFSNIFRFMTDHILSYYGRLDLRGYSKNEADDVIYALLPNKFFAPIKSLMEANYYAKTYDDTHFFAGDYTEDYPEKRKSQDVQRKYKEAYSEMYELSNYINSLVYGIVHEMQEMGYTIEFDPEIHTERYLTNKRTGERVDFFLEATVTREDLLEEEIKALTKELQMLKKESPNAEENK